MKRSRTMIALLAAILLMLGIACAEELAVADNDQASIYIRGFEKNLISYNMKVTLENKTDKPMVFTIRDVRINDIEAPTLWALEVKPNTQTRTQIAWIDLENDGITGDITSIGGSFRAYYSEDWTLPDALDSDFVYYPTGEAPMVIGEETGGSVIVADDERFAISVDSYQNSSLLYCYGMSVTIENRTDVTVMVTARDVSVNGMPCDPYWACELAPGERKKDTIGWFADTFEGNGITEVHEIVMSFIVLESGVWSGDALLEKTVTLKP